MAQSAYFNKHCDASILRQFRIESGHQSVDELASSMVDDLRENHFPEPAAGGTGSSDHGAAEEKQPNKEDFNLREDEVEAEFFEFPNQETTEEKQREKAELENTLKQTHELLAPFIERNTNNRAGSDN